VADSISDAPWDGSASDYDSAESYCSACLIDLNESGSQKTKDACKLPIRTPSGAINRNAVHAAAAALAGGRGGVQAPPAAKKAAARKLVSLYGQLKEDPPDSIKNMAG